MSANRILVQDAIYDEFAARLTKKVSALVVGEGLDEKVTVGPLINDAATEKVLGHVEDARAHGAVATVGGGAHARGGHFVAPTVLTGMTPAMRVAPRRPSAPSRRSSGSRRKTRRSSSPTAPRTAWPPITTPRTSGARGVWRSGSNSAWLASIPEASPSRWRPSAA